MKKLCPLCKSERPRDMAWHLLKKHAMGFVWSGPISAYSLRCPCGFSVQGTVLQGCYQKMNAHLTTEHIIELAVEAALRGGA